MSQGQMVVVALVAGGHDEAIMHIALYNLRIKCRVDTHVNVWSYHLGMIKAKHRGGLVNSGFGSHQRRENQTESSR